MKSAGCRAQLWLKSLTPGGANHTFLNLAKGATESTFYAHCLHDTLPEDLAVDLVIIEFAINDMRWDSRITPYMQNTKRCAHLGTSEPAWKLEQALLHRGCVLAHSS